MYRAHLVWLVPLLLHSGDACAWGLFTHVYFAHLLVWVIPLTDARFRRVLARFPDLVLAGACLPDLSLFGTHAGTVAFNSTHQWSTARRLLQSAKKDEERALALGFSSHLLVDIIAHNHFVPAHEKLWLDVPVVTHAVSEWAMDAHLGSRVSATPCELLRDQAELLATYAAESFGCALNQAKRSLSLLARGDNILRSIRIPQACYHGAKIADIRIKERFDYYLSETGARLAQINRILAGDEPAWHAELPPGNSAQVRTASYTLNELRHRMPLPQDLF